MKNDAASSPLGVAQREHSGAETFGKYEYQYHWALCRIIEEHKKETEYVVFVELHEDVVVADSLDPAVANFEFNQIKDISSKSGLTVKAITSGKPDKDSILSKLIKSIPENQNNNSINSINLVATCGFSIPLVDSALELEIIDKGSLSDKSLELLKDELTVHGLDEKLLEKINFVLPDFKNSAIQDVVIGRIATLVSKISASSHSKPELIYRVLSDEIRRKGVLKFDYKRWGELLNKKGITNETVSDVIEQHTFDGDREKLKVEFESLASDLSLQYVEKSALWKSAERYYLRKLSARNKAQLNIMNELPQLVEKLKSQNITSTLDMIEMIENQLTKDMRSLLGQKIDIRGAVICEIIQM